MDIYIADDLKKDHRFWQ